MAQEDLDRSNAEFWNELCGSGFASGLGLRDLSAASLKTFDDAYLAYYPYLLEHVPVAAMKGQRVLEIGLGYGTLGQRIADAGAAYTGMDIAAEPVQLMRYRLRSSGHTGAARQGSILDAPFEPASFDWVVSIGCFHHTGNMQRAVDETYRLLAPGGTAVIMVYNRFSLRQWRGWPVRTLRAALGLSSPASSKSQRKAYDASADGGAAPHTDFFSQKELELVFGRFSRVQMSKENVDAWTVPKLGWQIVSREALLGPIGRRLGLDIYLRAQK